VHIYIYICRYKTFSIFSMWRQRRHFPCDRQ